MSDTGNVAMAVHRATAQRADDRMRGFLDAHQHLVLATTNPDRTVHVVPYLYRFEGGSFLPPRPRAAPAATSPPARP
jgi:hypothetical protein